MVQASPAAAHYVGAVLLGGLIGTAITGKREGALIGASLGLLAAAMLSARKRDDLQPT